VRVIAPTHGLPITDMVATVRKVEQGLIAASRAFQSGTP
jgi:hypothetical protein